MLIDSLHIPAFGDRTLGKRREVKRIAKLTPAEIRRLILRNRIPLRELVEKSN